MPDTSHQKSTPEPGDGSVTSTDGASDNSSYTTSEQDEDCDNKMSGNSSNDYGNVACSSTAESSKSSFTTITVTSSVPTLTETETETTRKTDFASYSDNSDSAYTNSRSNFTQTLDSNATYTSEVQQSEVSDENDSSEAGKSRHLNESSTQTPGTANLNVISNVRLSEATLNVIFNQVLKDVGDKQPDSLNMKSLSALVPLKSDTKENEVNQQDIPDDSKVINVQPVPSFYLNRKEEIVVTQDHGRVIKYMISNVDAGSPYKPAEVPHVIVPRYSALPRTSSMEVNTSSVDSTDRESDTVSLVDSLEDGISPRNHQYNVRNPHEDEEILLPDNSELRKKSKTPQAKSAVFFIPIQNKQKEDFKPVSYHLPAKVKERLNRRQLKREQRMQQAKSSYNSPRSDSNYISASDNGNQISFTVNNNADNVDVKSIPLFPDINTHKVKRKSRNSSLPSIENVRKIRIDPKDHNIKVTECERIRDRNNKSMKKRCVTKYVEKNASRGENQRHQSSRSFHKVPAKLTPIYTSRNEYTCESMPKGIYRKTEYANSSKHIEILEIMECLDDAQKQHSSNNLAKSKSKIPILVQTKLPKIEKKIHKPVYLDFETVQHKDVKMDQLIANILMDTLNKYENLTPSPPNNENINDKRNILTKIADEKMPADIFQENTSIRYQQKFEVIPEELSRQSSLEETSNKSEQTVIEAAAKILTNNVLKNNNIQEELNKSSKNSSYDNSRSEDLKVNPVLSIPQGWITFYMLHKNQTSPDSTSDEGLKEQRTHQICKHTTKDCRKDSNTKSERLLENSDELALDKKDTKSRRDTLDTILSSDAFSDHFNSVAPNNDHQSSKQYTLKNLNNNNTNSYVNNNNNNNFNSCEKSNNTHGWSVTVSGMNTCGQFAPDVEMRLKFPTSKENVDFGSQTKLDHVGDVGNDTTYCHPAERPCQLLRRHNHQNCKNSVANITTGDESFRSGRLPIINQTRKFSQQIDPNLSNSVVPFGLEPRQTKTSTRRYALSRHRSLQSSDAHVTDEHFLNFSRQTGIFRRFPQILTVNGNSIDPENRSYVCSNRG